MCVEKGGVYFKSRKARDTPSTTMVLFNLSLQHKKDKSHVPLHEYYYRIRLLRNIEASFVFVQLTFFSFVMDEARGSPLIN